MNGERLYKHVSFRSTSVFSEVATEDKLFRFSSYGYQNGEVFKGIYPTCIGDEVRREMTKE